MLKSNMSRRSAVLAALAAPLLLTTAVAAQQVSEVQGPEVSVTAKWNEGRDGSGSYTAPAGYKIREIKVNVVSANGNTNYRTEIEGRVARVHVHAHGNGKFYDQKRGWLHVKSVVVLEKT